MPPIFVQICTDETLPLIRTSTIKCTTHQTLSTSTDSSTITDATNTAINKKQQLYGYVLMALSTFFYAGMATYLRLAQSTYAFPLMSVLFIRTVIQSSVSLLYLVSLTSFFPTISRLTRSQRNLLCLQALLGVVALISMFSSFRLLPAGDAAAIYFICPVFTLFLSVALIGEPLSPSDLVAGVCSILGVIVLAHTSSPSNHTDIQTSPTHMHRLYGTLLCLVSAFACALMYVILRKLGQSVHFMHTVFLHGIFTMIPSLIFGGIVTPQLIINNPHGFVTSVCAAIFGVGGISLLNLALQYCHAGRGLLIRNLDVPMTYALAVIVLREVPTFAGIVGATLVFLSAVIVGLRELGN